jgi:hypothetical protein
VPGDITSGKAVMQIRFNKPIHARDVDPGSNKILLCDDSHCQSDFNSFQYMDSPEPGAHQEIAVRAPAEHKKLRPP